MIGLCLKARGLGNARAFSALKRLMKQHSPDFVFLSKTKLAGRKADTVSGTFGNYDAFSVDCRGCSGGLMHLWKKVLKVKVLSFSVSHIDARIIMEDGFMWRFDFVMVEHLGFHSSDHRSILLRFDQNRPLLKSIFSGFRFEPYWLKDVDIGRVIGDAWCNSCASPIESAAHAIFWCKGAKNCWRFSKIRCSFEEVQQLPADEVFMFVSSMLFDKDLGSFCMLAWAIWSNRNNLYNTGKSKPSEMVESSAASLLTEFQRSKRAISPHIHSVQIKGGPDWIVPPPRQIKLNTATARRNNGLSTGVGAAIRDDKGLVVAARSNQLPGKFTVEMGELIALREGLQLAHFYNMKVDLAEVISPKVVSILNDSIPLVGESKFIMNDIKMLVSVVGITKCLAVSKSGNSLALNLANSAFASFREWLWLDFWS
ncbi:hypothetical protein EZV62_005913 [Acer yangbiense]|uniref:RNase H type-1 domain-containing protein n=1 Tax=Acer yangbiense TaxID=1000413 RepID=A0A5C7IPE9_9ROSI|nr:hypothetical protein EZV62_005913 [Acer yangbiense]